MARATTRRRVDPHPKTRVSSGLAFGMPANLADKKASRIGRGSPLPRLFTKAAATPAEWSSSPAKGAQCSYLALPGPVPERRGNRFHSSVIFVATVASNSADGSSVATKLGSRMGVRVG